MTINGVDTNIKTIEEWDLLIARMNLAIKKLLELDIYNNYEIKSVNGKGVEI